MALKEAVAYLVVGLLLLVVGEARSQTLAAAPSHSDNKAKYRLGTFMNGIHQEVECSPCPKEATQCQCRTISVEPTYPKEMAEESKPVGAILINIAIRGKLPRVSVGATPGMDVTLFVAYETMDACLLDVRTLARQMAHAKMERTNMLACIENTNYFERK